jgi:hypothetical protein
MPVSLSFIPTFDDASLVPKPEFGNESKRGNERKMFNSVSHILDLVS